MLPNTRLLTKNRNKLILGALALIVIVFAAAYFLKAQSTLQIVPVGNKFKLSFNLQRSDEPNFSNLLGKLNLSQSVKQGVQFELDSTSSAKLAFTSPINAKIALGTDTLNFKGTLTRNQNPTLPFENIKIPISANTAILGHDFKYFLKKNLQPPADLSVWIDKNLNSNIAQYLIVFGENYDFAVIFKSKEINFSDLKNIKDEAGQSIAKEETSDDTTFVLLKLKGNQNSPTIFQKNGWNYFVSSPGGAKDLESAAKSAGQTTEFPALPQRENLSMVISFVGKQNPAPLKYFFSSPDPIPSLTKQNFAFKFVLANNSFFGSFSVK